MTFTRLLIVVAIVSVLASASASTSRSSVPGPVGRVVLVSITGKGAVSSAPHGISCPQTCRAFFARNARVRLTAHPATGWRLARWKGSCTGHGASCAFDLASLECSGALCHVGALGVRVSFVRAGTDQ